MSEQSEQSELAQAIRELRDTVGGLQKSVDRNTEAINTLTGRFDKLDKTMEQVGVRLASKLDAGEVTGLAEATNTRLDRLERTARIRGTPDTETHADSLASTAGG